ncbi:cytochrome P450 [Sistotremastrum suecicum HHB10207 ss-3]|uniref:Cytochrome P450 n=1 Tax=Sistotremastrum suecicum HHB10207 ss-3 TaxID=1314776 RepID=A0A165YI59_9AGAM|nr:cytochrome P450 [Sistotremastrum suecicum HHB10207 ss-3]
MATALIEENLRPDGTIVHEELISGALGITYLVSNDEGGADTTVSSLDTFMIAMMLNPVVQREAQKSIDEVLQGERLPNLDDRPSLPFLDALFMEIQRWKPVVPGGIAHRSTHDDIYEGILIPKGTMIIFNVMAIMHNPDDFPNPEIFNPYRFLESDGDKHTLKKVENDPLNTAFGYGPRKRVYRICPGRHFATSWLWLEMSTILAIFDISPMIDAAGNDILPDLEYVPAVVSHPKPFQVSLKRRDNIGAVLAAADLI